METLLIIAAVGTLNVVCFFVGAKVGQTVASGKDIEVPTIKSPLEMVKDHQEKKAYEHERNKINTLLANIDNYDGTSIGQKDIPR